MSEKMMAEATKIKIFRVHHPEAGVGPYCSERGIQSMKWECPSMPFDTGGYHPSPWNDPKLKSVWNDLDWTGQYGNFYFGFADMEQFHIWFHNPEWLHELKRLGYVLTIWEVDKESVFVGEFQAVFHMYVAEWVDTQDLI